MRWQLRKLRSNSTNPFAEVVSAIAAQVGHPDITQFYLSVQTAEDDVEVQRLVGLPRILWKCGGLGSGRGLGQ
jgi:hypothetical protein